jgi:hypothetical protein
MKVNKPKMGRPKLKRQTLETTKAVSFTKTESLAIDTLCKFKGSSASSEIRGLMAGGLLFYTIFKNSEKLDLSQEQKNIYRHLLKNWVHNPNSKDAKPFWVELMESEDLDKEAKKFLVDFVL